MGPNSLRRAAGALLGAAVLAAPFATGAAGAAPCAGARFASPDWLVIAAPRFPAGPQSLSAYAVDPANPDRFLATNGTALMLSTDRGCSWRPAYRLPELPSLDSPFTSDNARIAAIAFPERSSGSAYATVEERSPTARPHVLASRDRGRSWRLADTGLPAAGAPETLVIAPSAPNVLFLGIDVGGGALDTLFASTDGARTWTLRSSATDLRPKNVEGLAVDPLDLEVLWAWGPGGLYRSGNGGRDFTAIPEFAGHEVGPVDVFHGPGASARVVAFVPEGGIASVSTDGGRTWGAVGAPPSPDSLAHGVTADRIGLAASGRLYAYHAPSFAWIDLNAPRVGLVQVQADRTPDSHLYVRNADAILGYFGRGPGDSGLGLDKILRDVPLIQTPEIPEVEPPRLTPERRRVVVGLGQSKRIRYTLRLPTRPVPVDVFFVLDTSPSMAGLITGLTRAVAGIVNGLAEERVDAQFGLAEFRDYPSAFPPRPDEPNFVYRRRLDIGATGPQLREVLESLDVSEGGGPYNAHLGALYQAATGEGQDVDPPGPLGEDVPPGQQANFRTKALRVVLLSSDDPFWRGKKIGLTNPQEPPDVPSEQEVERAFNQRGIRHLALSLGSWAAPSFRGLSEGTKSVAPAGGVDCNGDGDQELRPGDPLVCVVARNNIAQGGHMSEAIVDLVRAVRTTGEVSLSVSGGDAVVSRVQPRTYRRVVVQTTPRLTFDVTYRCGGRDAGKRFGVDLLAKAGFRRADASTVVVCRDRPVFDTPLAVIPPLAASALVPPPPPPPPVVPELGTQVQSQAQAHAQAAAAAQEEEQPQVAAAHSFRAGLEEEYAFSSYRRSAAEEPMGALVLGAGAVAMAFAYAVAIVARQAVRVQRARR